MKKIFESGVKGFKDEDIKIDEKIYIFEIEEETDDEDFSLFSHNEQIKYLNLAPEKSTPISEHATVNRYIFDVSDCFVVVHEIITTW